MKKINFVNFDNAVKLSNGRLVSGEMGCDFSGRIDDTKKVDELLNIKQYKLFELLGKLPKGYEVSINSIWKHGRINKTLKLSSLVSPSDIAKVCRVVAIHKLSSGLYLAPMFTKEGTIIIRTTSELCCKIEDVAIKTTETTKKPSVNETTEKPTANDYISKGLEMFSLEELKKALAEMESKAEKVA